jgi:NADH dehydrogenase [ubiquinone] 1 alpha subcomplex assembly factor 5
MQPIFDRNRLKLHRDRAAFCLHKHDFLLRHSASILLEHINSIDYSKDSILELGARTGALTELLMDSYPASKILATDISEVMLGLNPSGNKMQLDEEELIFDPQSFDVIASNLNIHWINDMPKFFGSVASALKHNGIFVASLFGGSSLTNLRKSLLQSEIAAKVGHSPHISPFATANDIYRLLQGAGFEFIVVDKQKIELEYDNPLAFMKELRGIGESSNLISNTRPLSKLALQNLDKETFIEQLEIITLVASRNKTLTSPNKLPPPRALS